MKKTKREPETMDELVSQIAHEVESQKAARTRRKEIAKIEFDICRAHNNMQDKLVSGGSKRAAVNFLKKQKTPFDFDVRGRALGRHTLGIFRT